MSPIAPITRSAGGYFTTARWIDFLRALPPEGSLLHVNSYRLLTRLDEKTLRQACWRLGRKGILTHLGGGWYTHAFARLAIEELAPVLVRPSYVSLEWVLAARGVTTQPSAYLTCVTTEPTQIRKTALGEMHYQSRPIFFGDSNTASPRTGSTCTKPCPRKLCSI